MRMKFPVKPFRVSVVQCRGTPYQVGRAQARLFAMTLKGRAFLRNKTRFPWLFDIRAAQRMFARSAPVLWEELTRSAAPRVLRIPVRGAVLSPEGPRQGAGRSKVAQVRHHSIPRSPLERRHPDGRAHRCSRGRHRVRARLQARPSKASSRRGVISRTNTAAAAHGSRSRIHRARRCCACGKTDFDGPLMTA
jgi:hypothetical protein